ncbi:MAG: hypothetical protein K2X09_00215, partial [Rickettsiales bacterium]|nr:hypothetical protein [Rickettsiales bacterium]
MRHLPVFSRALAFSLLLLAAPVFAASLEDTYATWETLRSPDTAAVRFDDGYQFLQKNPAWPEEKIIRLRTEAAAMEERPALDVMARFCADYPPISGRGMIACAVAKVGDAATQAQLVRTAWIQGDFNEDEELRVLKSYSETITHAEHRARMDRLLYEGKLKPAKRMLARVSVTERNLFSVRLALLANEKNAPRLVNTLTASQQRDAGILFERLRWRTRKGDDDLFSLLNAAPKTVPYPELWWPMRASIARDAIGKGNFKQALAVIAPHGELSGEAL